MFSPAVARMGHILLCGALLLPALTACTGQELRSSFGLKRNNPDEFRVVSRPPLSVPPVYHLRPPAEGQGANNVTPADKRAESLLFEGEELPLYQRPDDPAYQPETAVTAVQSGSLGTSGESLLLQNAGASEAKADIRATLREENAPLIAEEKKKKGFLEKLRPGDEEPIVDAKKEQERIRTNKAEGKPVNEGETAVIDPKEESVLDKLLN